MDEKIAHVLIGGSGFIGIHLRDKLALETVVIVDKNEPKGLRSNERWICRDIRKQLTGLDLDVDEQTVVHHLAAVHFDFQRDFFETNVEGTKHVIAAFPTCRQWVFYSSVATYGDSAEVSDELSEQLPCNDYGKSKLEMERIIFSSHASGDLKGRVVVVRPGVVYGEWNFGNVFNLMRFSSRFVPVGLDKNPIKSMAYVKNLVASTLFALENSNTENPFVFNYVDYEQLGTKDLLQHISVAKGQRSIFLSYRLVFGLSVVLNLPFKLLGTDFLLSPMRIKKFAQPTHFAADKIRSLGFVQPRAPVDAVNRTISWINSNNVAALRKDWKESFKDE